ncbi:TonB-dependent receptor [Niabella pedocola]|uniref:TonB-dependent receptor n=1 Tax=Niabella pedocola TaxID=1752077 RepID=A0ABS8PWZ7_9BACT|nr:TonB-dependent receptor [Niabella pedocola]MCD2424802.1 TonB-dependent receptor [Niabella pedocola]
MTRLFARHKRPFALCLLCFLCSFLHTVGYAQSGPVSGVVLDPAGAPVAGASIVVKDGLGTAVADEGGHFTIQTTAANAVLVVTAVGYTSREVAATGNRAVEITLELAAKQIDEVVVIGYGTQKRGNLTSAVSSVKGDVISKMATNNPINALQGRVAGLSVTSPGGNPGQMSDVRLRGIGTFGGHQPLYIIDGVPGDPYYLNNNDIESIEVLKDGAAASIYGSNSANGVVIVTTKKGKKGEPVIDFSSYYGQVKPTNKYKLLDAEGYKSVHRMMYENAGNTQLPAYITTNTGVNTNWQDQIQQTGTAQNYNVGIRGGGEFIKYGISGDLTDEKGTLIGSSFDKKTIRSTNEIKKGILTLENNLLFSNTRSEAYKFDIRDAYFQSPLLPVTDPGEPYGYGLTVNGLPKFQNPVGYAHYVDGYTKTQYFADNLRLRLQLFKGFSYTAQLNYISANSFDYSHHPPFRANANDPAVSYSYVYNSRSNYKEQQMEHLLNYDWKKGDHSLKVLAGYSAQQKTNEYLSVTADGKTIVRSVVNGSIVEKEVAGGFSNPDFNTINAGLGGTFGASGSNNKYVRLSTFGRINYDYAGKYLVQASVRRDGSSVFGQNNQFGTFPSASVGWNMHQESFLKNSRWLNVLKLRASYGELGNEGALGYYDHQALISTLNTWAGGYVQGSGATPWPGSASYTLQNRDLKWETSKSTNIGADFAFLNNKLTGSVNYFNNKTEGLLITKEVPPSAGVNDPILNVGTISNKGIELELTYNYAKNDWNVAVTGSVTRIKNEVIKLAQSDQTLYGTGLKFGTDHIPTQTKEGNEIGAFYLYTADGIFQSDAEAAAYVNKDGERLQADAKAGDVKFLDTNGDGVIDEKDKTYQGSGFPKMEYGLNLSVGYKSFDLTAFFQGVSGNKIYNGYRFELEGMDAGRNFLTTALNAWTPQNTHTTVPRAVLGDPNGNNRESTRFLENGSYLRMKLLQLGYSLPATAARFARLNRLRIYVAAQNLFTITKYSALDPEVGVFNPLNTGVDRALYPQNKRWLVGLQIGL